MRRTATLLGGGVACLLAAVALEPFVGFDAPTALTLLGVRLVVAAIASSYVSDLLEGHRSAGEE